MDLQLELEAAMEAVTTAARLAVQVQKTSQLGTLQKGDRSPVTVADFGSQALVCRELLARFPDDPVIAEEAADVLREAGNEPLAQRVLGHVSAQVPGATMDEVLHWIDRGTSDSAPGRFWTLDPIDGTKGFLRGDQFAVALALVEDGRPVIAALACPSLSWEDDDRRGVVMWASRGGGTWQRPMDGSSEPVAARVSQTGDETQARFSESFESSHSSHDDAARVAAALGITRRPLRLDSQAKYAVVARGDAEIYMRLPTRNRYIERIWDHAAGTLVVQEAGGRVTDVNGKALEFGHGRTLASNLGVAVTNGGMHDRLLAALKDQRIGER